jgi:hypothetical protein
MSKHSKTTFIRARDGCEVTADEAFSKDGLLKSGFSIRRPMFALDSTQKAVAGDGLTSTVKYQGGKVSHVVEAEDPDSDDDEDEVDDSVPTVLSDGTAAVDHRPGFRTAKFATDSTEHAEQVTNDVLLNEAYAEHAAAEANAWRGDSGKQSGDKPKTDSTAASMYEQYDADAATQYTRAK